jgi:hypothetical protein
MNITVVDESTIEVDNIPHPNIPGGLPLVWNTTSCVAAGDVPGTRNTDTPVDVRVTNYPGGCQDTLSGGLIYQPTNTDCTATGPAIQTSPSEGAALPNFNHQFDGGCSGAPQSITIQNIGGADLTIGSVNLGGNHPGDFQITQSPGSPVAPAGTASPDLQVDFCPAADYNSLRNATVEINTNAANDPQVVIGLIGQETP